MIERLFPDQTSLIADLSAQIVERLQDGVVERGRAGLVVTGGSTPGRLYDMLSGLEAPWDRTWITLTDERWLPADHPDSNAYLVRQRLLLACATGAHFIPLKTDDASPGAALQAIDARIAAMPRPFDGVVLGMGEDGHIASLFPGAVDGLDPVSGVNVVAVERPGGAGSAHRLSLTLSALTDSRWIAVMITGQAKLDRLRAPEGTPVAALLRQDRVPVEVFWSP